MPQPGKSDRLKQQQGTFRRDRQKPDIQGAGTPPECPDWLKEGAKQHWNNTVKHLIDLGVALHPADQDCLATYCSLFARQMQNPEAFGPALFSQLRAFQTQFGLTPLARENLGINIRPKKPNRFLD